MSRAALPVSFFDRPVLAVARDLLGRRLVRVLGGERVGGRIVETEAYGGEDDQASHARGGPTARCRVMFGPPGRTYVYLIYGMHNCLNLVCESEGRAAAVLLRAIEPDEGMGLIESLRPGRAPRELASGPGRLCAALAVSRLHDGLLLPHAELRIEEGTPLPARGRMATPRIGVAYAGAAAAWPWRFVERDSDWVSRPPQGRTVRRA